MTDRDPLAEAIDRLTGELAAAGASEAATQLTRVFDGVYTTSTEYLVTVAQAIAATRDLWAPYVSRQRRREIDRLRRQIWKRTAIGPAPAWWKFWT